MRAIAEIADARLSRREGVEPHVAQALDILDGSDVLLAIYDGQGNNGAGGTGDTLEKARARGKPVIVIDRDPSTGRWRDSAPEA